MTVVKTTEIFSDTRGVAQCRGCSARIEFAEIVTTGKRMPFDYPIVALATRYEEGRYGRRWIEKVELATNHFATCPKAAAFSRR